MPSLVVISNFSFACMCRLLCILHHYVSGGSQAQYHGLDRMTNVPFHFDLLWCQGSKCISGYSQCYSALGAHIWTPKGAYNACCHYRCIALIKDTAIVSCLILISGWMNQLHKTTLQHQSHKLSILWLWVLSSKSNYAVMATHTHTHTHTRWSQVAFGSTLPYKLPFWGMIQGWLIVSMRNLF